MQMQPLISLFAVCLNKKTGENVNECGGERHTNKDVVRCHCSTSTNVTRAFLQHPLALVSKSAMMCTKKALGTKVDTETMEVH